MSLTRRRLVATSATALAFSGYARLATGTARAADDGEPGYGPLRPDPLGVFDLPEGFSYRIVSQVGETMDDGLLTPGNMDGMGCFPMGGSVVALVRNHELRFRHHDAGPCGVGHHLADRLDPARVFDRYLDGRALTGGTSTILWDVAAGRRLGHHLSLAGTSVNCAGGVTPWGSWLSCEETSRQAGDGVQRDHGWVFEVPADLRGLAEPTPLTGLGRFDHEAACVDPRTGVVYLTEDRDDSCFYRFLPESPGRLAAGGRLQALAWRGAPGADTRNWDEVVWRQGDWRACVWVDLDHVDAPGGDLRLRARAAGAAVFARGEGLTFGAGEAYFTATSGGVGRIGQILRYVPSPHEGQPGEADEPGRLQLFLESVDETVYDYGDNLTVAPWGDLIVCEDRYSDEKRNHLRGVTPDGQVYLLGRNVFAGNGELAGACFSPDGSTLFVNIYSPGLTLAITGPWRRVRSS